MTKRRMSIAIRILAIATLGALATQGSSLSVSFIFGLFLGCALGMVEAAE